MTKTQRLPALLKKLAAVLAIAAFTANAWAGEFYEKAGAAIKGHDPVAYFKDGKPMKGSPDHKADYKGSVFHFSSKANRDAFAADPAKYAPQYNGFCAFGAAGGYKAAVDPDAFTVVNDKLYLNYQQGHSEAMERRHPRFRGQGR